MSKKILVIICFVLFLTLIVAVFGYFTAMPAKISDESPKIIFENDFYDFKEVEFGEIIEYDFVVKNEGKQDLSIIRVATSCGCTTAEMENKIITAGESSILRVKYDTGAMGKTSHGTGQQERIIYLKTNDPLRPQAEVKIQAYVK